MLDAIPASKADGLPPVSLQEHDEPVARSDSAFEFFPPRNSRELFAPSCEAGKRQGKD